MAERAQKSEQVPDTELVARIRAELDALLQEPPLSNSERLKRFLRHVVIETIEGRSDRLSGYTIALDVFDKEEDFDPALDSIVRVEASRLRTRLVQHYAETRRQSEIKIVLPKGTYVPVFERHTPAQVMPSSARPPERRRPSIAVLPFAALGRSDDDRFFADGLTEETIANLCKFKDLFVFSRSTTSKLARDGADVRELRETLGADFVLEGSVRQSTQAVRVTAQLIDAETGGHIFAESLDRACTPEGVFEIQDEIALLVAARIGDRHGPLGRYIGRAHREGATRKWETYDLINRFYAYYATHDPDLHLQLRDGLGAALEQDIESSDGWAALSIVLLDEHRLHLNERHKLNKLDLALEHALRAVQCDPESAFAYHALTIAYFHLGETTDCRISAKRCLELNPGKSDALADVGFSYCLLGDWDEGLKLLEQAIALSPVHPGWFHMPFASRYILDGEYENAIIETRKVPMPGFPWYHAVAACAHALNGSGVMANREVDALNEVYPAFGANADQELELLGIRDDLAVKLKEGWRRAGMQLH